MPVKPVMTAPTTTITAPDKPEAVADKSLLTDMIAKLALGDVNPFPTPTQIVPPKKVIGETKPSKKAKMHARRPKHATKRPDRIIVSILNFAAYLPDKKLPTRNPHVMVPTQIPIWACVIPNCFAAISGTPVTKVKNAPIPKDIISVYAQKSDLEISSKYELRNALGVQPVFAPVSGR
jgi:hypothetical protein